ncbi:MAG: serine/threonine-protein phosphatase [Phycisphaerales bacterium]|nr:MAG: serine/threonine-protein phosphatase [Phycisphaerales bacterium]
MTSTLTMDFREEYEAERSRWLRRRVLWFCGVSLVLAGLSLMALAVSMLPAVAGAEGPPEMPALAVVLAFASQMVSAVLLFAVLMKVARSLLRSDQLHRIVFWTIVAIGLVNLLPVPAVAMFDAGGDAGAEGPQIQSVAPLMTVLWVHFLAALFISWTPKEAISPLIPLLIVSAVITLAFSPATLPMRVVYVALSPLVGVPGVLIGWWRHSRFRQEFHLKMLRGHYGTMKRELTNARRIQEVLFPQPITGGPVRFDFRYEPMRQIGGDYLYSALDESRDGSPARLNVVIIDVTGHGISAALTVNRIHGELERLFGERQDLSPHDALAALNHYINVTLAKHNVYATALCLRVDPEAEIVEWASAGHPPAFLLNASGLIDRLEPTAYMLGATGDDVFQPNGESMPFKRGDAIVAYTDGVIEARNRDGRMLTIEGVQAIMATLAGGVSSSGYAESVLRAVREHRFGAVDDDTLIVEVSRPLGV